VPQTDRAGLDEHLIRSGLALRVLPERPEPVVGRVPIDADRMRRALIGRARGDRIDTAVAPSFVLRGLGPGGGYLPPEARHVVAGYRVLYLLLAEHELAVSANAQAARAVLDEMERTLPSERHPMPYWMHATLATLSERTGDRDAARRHARIAIEQVNALGERWNRHPQAAVYHPIETKVRMLAFVGEYDEGIRTFEQLRRSFPRDHHLRAQIEELRVERHLSRRDTAAALRELDAIVAGYSGIEEPALRNNAAAFEAVRDELMGD
jgi:hypothetical protein